MKGQYEIKYCNILIINHEYLSNKYSIKRTIKAMFIFLMCTQGLEVLKAYSLTKPRTSTCGS